MINLAFMVFQTTRPMFSRLWLWDKDFSVRCLFGGGAYLREVKGDREGKEARTGCIKNQITTVGSVLPGASERLKTACLQLGSIPHLLLVIGGELLGCGWELTPNVLIGLWVTSIYDQGVPQAVKNCLPRQEPWVLRGYEQQSYILELELRGKRMQW